MPRCLLWNVQRKDRTAAVRSLVLDHAIDLVILVEPSSVSTDLSPAGLSPVPAPDRFRLFAAAGSEVVPLDRFPRSNDRSGYWSVRSRAGADGLLVVVHGYDRRNYSDATRAVQFRQVADLVERYEQAAGHRRTVVAGDFNAHPFEPAVCGANGLHALGVRAVRDRPFRRVGDRPRAFFYNPMWRLYGHTGDAGTATHHWIGTDADALVWHMLDQVVVRPEEASRLPDDRVRILTAVGGHTLLDRRGVPDRRTGSDHLPVLFDWLL